MIIDADTHVIESEQMWDLIEPPLQRRRPIMIKIPSDTAFGDRNAFWLIDGKIHPKPIGHGAFRLHTPATSDFELSRTDTTRECREITDIDARIADMDRQGIDVQVIYPTFFLQPVTSDVELQVGLCRAYNQYLADVWARSGGRLRWVVVLPLASPSDIEAEIAFGKSHGAVGVFMHGFEDAGSAGDRAFFKLYGQALEHNLAICVHTGVGSTNLAAEGAGFAQTAVIHAFRDIVVNSVPQEFPGLRFGFIEAGSSWLPYVFHGLVRSRKARSPRVQQFFSQSAPEPAELMRQANLYVASQADEDLEYLLRIAAPENLVIGSDYGHVDPAFEAEMNATLRGREGLDSEIVEGMLSSNPMALYGIGEEDLAGAASVAASASQ